MKEAKLMKGNEAFAEAAILCGADAYFGYPITPQSEVMEYLMDQNTEERTGMVVLQAESELAAINMVYAGAGCGKKVLTSSSGPGMSLMQEGVSYIVGAELPCVLANVMRGGPGLGTIQPSQADYFQAVKGGGHGDYKLITFAPASVQEMADFVAKAFDLAFKYRNPVMILSDGIMGQMMEKVVLPEQKPRWTNEEVTKLNGSWATIGKPSSRERNTITSVFLVPEDLESHNIKLQKKFRTIEENEVKFEKINCDDAEYLLIAFGTSARVCQKAVELGREKGIKVGLLRPITLWPFPTLEIQQLSKQVKGILSVEMSAGQMVEDVRLAVNGKIPVHFFGKMGGIVPNPEEVLENLEKQLIG